MIYNVISTQNDSEVDKSCDEKAIPICGGSGITVPRLALSSQLSGLHTPYFGFITQVCDCRFSKAKMLLRARPKKTIPERPVLQL